MTLLHFGTLKSFNDDIFVFLFASLSFSLNRPIIVHLEIAETESLPCEGGHAARTPEFPVPGVEFHVPVPASLVFEYAVTMCALVRQLVAVNLQEEIDTALQILYF